MVASAKSSKESQNTSLSTQDAPCCAFQSRKSNQLLPSAGRETKLVQVDAVAALRLAPSFQRVLRSSHERLRLRFGGSRLALP